MNIIVILSVKFIAALVLITINCEINIGSNIKIYIAFVTESQNNLQI